MPEKLQGQCSAGNCQRFATIGKGQEIVEENNEVRCKCTFVNGLPRSVRNRKLSPEEKNEVRCKCTLTWYSSNVAPAASAAFRSVVAPPHDALLVLHLLHALCDARETRQTERKSRIQLDLDPDPGSRQDYTTF